MKKEIYYNVYLVCEESTGSELIYDGISSLDTARVLMNETAAKLKYRFKSFYIERVEITETVFFQEQISGREG